MSCKDTRQGILASEVEGAHYGKYRVGPLEQRGEPPRDALVAFTEHARARHRRIAGFAPGPGLEAREARFVPRAPCGKGRGGEVFLAPHRFEALPQPGGLRLEAAPGKRGDLFA